ncbi:hypothetical protein BF29_284 [Heyndrickxia coagulans DSM 1 = ATCC 7050]|uniref:Uncharacterized protein n=1 Tax=Heyndrickxia coagulans DSM 1 = ATCC 7050 TaxID=1121088 RepID=A0A8B4BSI9_HEYCO|nr:hypothetical protein BF29_284 [Heyndrickxia coagulans DSM 1 = ATCC 7050]SHE27286.1 hypothetical protein SAMN02745208_00009 [Heyndrickxia coagulans DSM 1 = ATCC 7050]
MCEMIGNSHNVPEPLIQLVFSFSVCKQAPSLLFVLYSPRNITKIVCYDAIVYERETNENEGGHH